MSKATTKRSQKAEEQAAQKTEEQAAQKAEEQTALVLTDEQARMIASSRYAGLVNKTLALMGCQLDAIGDDATKKALEVCRIYHEISDGQLYKEDGFKNLDEFAQKFFKEGKSSASQKAKVFSIFFSDKSTDTAKKVRELIGDKPSVLYELSKATDEELSKALEKGQIYKDMTQDKARSLWKDVIKPARSEGKEKVVKTVKYSGTHILMPYESTDGDGNTKKFDGEFVSTKDEHVPADNDSILDSLGFDTKAQLLTAKFDKVTYRIAVNENGNLAIIVTQDDTEKPKKEDKKAEPDIPVLVATMVRNLEQYGLTVEQIITQTGLDEHTVRLALGDTK